MGGCTQNHYPCFSAFKENIKIEKRVPELLKCFWYFFNQFSLSETIIE